MQRLDPANLRRENKKKDSDTYWLKLNLGHKALDRIGLDAVLRCDEVKATCPCLRTLERTRICNKLGTTVGDIVLNASSPGINSDSPIQSICNCSIQELNSLKYDDHSCGLATDLPVSEELETLRLLQEQLQSDSCERITSDQSILLTILQK